MADKKLTKTALRGVSDEELNALSMQLGDERADAEAGYKEQQQMVNAERDRRSLVATVAALPAEVKTAILAGAGHDDDGVNNNG